MKTRLLTAAALCAALVSGCGHGDIGMRQFKATKTVTQSRPAEGLREIRVQTVSGDIAIRPGKGKNIVIVGTKEVFVVDRRRADRKLNELEMVIEQNGDALIIRTVRPKWPMRDVNGDIGYAIEAPAGVAVKTKSVSGDITVEGVGKQVDAAAVSGDVNISGALGGVNVKTVSGSARLTNCARDTEAQTVSGDIVYASKQVDASRLELRTVSGDVDMSVPKGFPLALSMSSVSGDVRNELGNMKGMGAQQNTLFQRGEGGAKVMISTTSGDIRIGE